MTKMIFSAGDGIHGTELWITDGTAAGTSLVLDINNTGSASASPAGPVFVGNGAILFRASDGVHGSELWTTDGTAAGTSMILDINSGSASSTPRYFTTVASGKILFQASDGTTAGLHGTELWVTDGTTAGTSLLKDINTSSTGASANPKYITLLGNGTAVFQANDGTTAGLHGVELWVTDGTAAGTSMVQDMNPGTLSSTPKFMTAIGNGKALFQAADATHGSELWITNGTSAGTSMLLDIRAGATSSAPKYFVPLGNGKTVFRATDGTHGYELWVTDGTAANTSMVKDISSTGSTSSNPVQLFSMGNGEVLFEASDGTHGAELWITDGTSAGTTMVADINPGANSSFPQGFAALGNGKFLFQANDGTHGYELWITDGTGAGTSMVLDIFTGTAANSGNPAYFTLIGNGQALFQATDGNLAHGTELWTTDGTAAGTSMVKDVNATAVGASSSPANLATFCFVTGTLIDTPSGRVPVENLRVADIALTASGGEQPIVWIGKGQVLAARGQRGAATPVIVRKGALADNVPHHDLHVTKGHSLFLDDVLIPVEFLVNHRSILWDDHAQVVELYHIELERHDVLLANGAPAESYRDDGNRRLFQNANSGWDQPPKPPCAPVLTGGPLVDAVWRRLLDRCGPRPNVPLTNDPGLHLVVDGVRLEAAQQTGNVYFFNVPDTATDIHIVSRAAAPQELGLTRDPRVLGVALRRIDLRQGGTSHIIHASDPGLVDGFHAFEAGNDFRWTDGDAIVPAERLGRFAGPFEIDISVSGMTQYVADSRIQQVA